MSLKEILTNAVCAYKQKNSSSIGITMGQDGIKRADDLLNDIAACKAGEAELCAQTLDLIKGKLGTSKQLRKYLARGLCEYLGISPLIVATECLNKKYWRLGIFRDPNSDTNAMIELIEQQVQAVGIKMENIDADKKVEFNFN